MKVLVTGGAGFIGSNLVRALLKRGDHVRVLDNYSTGKAENLQGLEGPLEVMDGDLRSYPIVRESVEGMEVVLHQAALGSVPRSIRDPLASHEVNVTGTLHVLQAARDAGVKRVVYASSSSVYGDTPQLPKHEGMVPNPMSPYAVSKLAAERYCAAFTKVYGLETVALRYFNVFGPRQDPASQYAAVLPLFITSMLEGKPPVIFGDGEQSRDFTYIDNVVSANILAATRDVTSGLVANCACHQRITLNEIIAKLNVILETRSHPIYRDPRVGDVKHSFASIDLIRDTLGYEPIVEFDDGLRMTVDWYRDRVNAQRMR